MSEYIVGRNAVIEYLKSDRSAQKLYIQSGDLKGSIHKIIALAKEKSIPITRWDKNKLDQISDGLVHQGVALLADIIDFSSVEDIIDYGKSKGEKSFVLLLDGIIDPHNFGAILRTAEAAGVDGVIVPKRNSAPITSVVHKSSAGAASYIKIAQVSNINSTIDLLKDQGFWVYGADGNQNNKDYKEDDYSTNIALVIGNEGKGLSKLTKTKCDFLIKIPMYGRIDSLNASASASILIYEITNKRFKNK